MLLLPSLVFHGCKNRKPFKHINSFSQVDDTKPVLVPGDPERAHMEKVDVEGGIQYHINLIDACDKLADKLNIPKIGSL